MSSTKTKEKPAKTRTEGLEGRLRELERQRRQAQDAIVLAGQRTEEIATRQHQIAVAVVGEDPEAAAENERLEDALLIENRRRATARSAAEQLDEQIAQVKQDLAAEKRLEHLERAAVLARDRHDLEVRAEENVGRLLATLGELASLDRRQCGELRAGEAEAPTEPLGWTIEPWLLTRLGEWVGENPRHQGFVGKALPELDGFAEPRER